MNCFCYELTFVYGIASTDNVNVLAGEHQRSAEIFSIILLDTLTKAYLRQIFVDRLIAKLHTSARISKLHVERDQLAV